MGCLPLKSFIDIQKTPQKYNSSRDDKLHTQKKKRALESIEKQVHCLNTVSSERSDKNATRRTVF